MLGSKFRDGRVGNVGFHSDLTMLVDSTCGDDLMAGRSRGSMYGLAPFDPAKEVAAESVLARRAVEVGEIATLWDRGVGLVGLSYSLGIICSRGSDSSSVESLLRLFTDGED
jgi:hypothetical protein